MAAHASVDAQGVVVLRFALEEVLAVEVDGSFDGCSECLADSVARHQLEQLEVQEDHSHNSVSPTRHERPMEASVCA